MAKTSRDARRHIKELVKLFSDVKEVAEFLVDDFTAQYKKSKYLKQSLSRFLKRGLIVKRGSKFVVSDKGANYFRRYQPVKSPDKKWDGKWRLISFDVPTKDDTKRNRLRALLKEFDFYQLQKSVWICPNYLTEDLWKLVVKNDLDKYCKVMLVEFVEGDTPLKKHFNLV